MTPAEISVLADWVFLGGALFGLGFAVFVGRAMLRIERELRQLKEAHWHFQRHGAGAERDLLGHYR